MELPVGPGRWTEPSEDANAGRDARHRGERDQPRDRGSVERARRRHRARPARCGLDDPSGRRRPRPHRHPPDHRRGRARPARPAAARAPRPSRAEQRDGARLRPRQAADRAAARAGRAAASAHDPCAPRRRRARASAARRRQAAPRQLGRRRPPLRHRGGSPGVLRGDLDEDRGSRGTACSSRSWCRRSGTTSGCSSRAGPSSAPCGASPDRASGGRTSASARRGIRSCRRRPRARSASPLPIASRADFIGIDLLPLGDGYTVIELNGAADFNETYSLPGTRRVPRRRRRARPRAGRRYVKMLTARAATSSTVTAEAADSASISAFARRLSGIASVGLNAIEFVNEM